MKQRIVMGCVLLAALAGCGQGGEDDDSEPDKDAAETSDSGDTWPDAVAAMRAAEHEIDDGTLVALERQRDCDGQPCWEISVAASTDQQFEVWVSQDGSEVLASDSEDEVDDDAALAVEAEHSAIEVVEAAAADYDGVVAELEIDTLGDGTAVWEVTLDDNGSGTEYKFDTASAEAISSAPAED